MDVIQTNLKLTLKSRTRLMELAKLTRRHPRDVMEILLEGAQVRREPDIIVGVISVAAGNEDEGPGDAA